MSLQVGIDRSGEPIFMWDLPTHVLRRAAETQRCWDELNKADRKLADHTKNLERLFGRGRVPDLPSLRRLEADVRRAEIGLRLSLSPQRFGADLADLAADAAAAFERFGTALTDAVEG